MEAQTPENGQIHMNTPFGKWLFDLATVKVFKTYVEVGTWRGNGTTKCVVNGLAKRESTENVHFYSFEANKAFYSEAVARYSAFSLPYLHLLYGKLHSNGLMTKEQIESHPLFNHVETHYRIWYNQDVIDYDAAPLADTNQLPTEVDVIILDGGEFSGYADWLALKDKNPKVVCLDDSNIMKNERVYKELNEDPTWKLIAGDNDRNGWAIFAKLQ